MTSSCDCDAAPSGAIPARTRRPAAAGPRPWLGLALLALPTLLLGLDLTLLHLALPALAADLRPTATQALWIVDAYGFMIAGFLVTMGTLGDRIGRRRLLMIGAAAFALASVAAALSTGAGMLIAARAALGVAGATLMPSTLALITTLFADPRRRALAIGIWATTFALGMALGPVVGGVVLDRFGWQAAFLVALPVVGLLLALAPVLLPEYRAPRAAGLDLVSVGLSLAAMLPMIYGLKHLARDGFTPDAGGAVAAGAVVAILFVRRQRRLADPLLDLGLFAGRAFGVALVVLLFGLVAVGGTLLLVAQYLQGVVGLLPLAAGLWMGLPALAMVAAGVTAPLLARRVRPGFVVAGALALSALGYALLAGAGTGPSGLGLVLAGFSLAYLGLGVIAALGTDLVVGSAPPEKAGSASALSETVQDLGASLGVALLGSLSGAIYRRAIVRHVPDDLPGDLRAALLDGLWSVLAVAPDLPVGLIGQARAAFTAGLAGASAVSAIGVAILAVFAAVALRHVERPGPSSHGT
ncbi:MAG: MFS transporter [Methylobacterium frigidaeris]